MLNSFNNEYTFKVEQFEPIHLKKAHKILDKHFAAAEIHTELNNVYKKGTLKEVSLLKKVWSLFKE